MLGITENLEHIVELTVQVKKSVKNRELDKASIFVLRISYLCNEICETLNSLNLEEHKAANPPGENVQ